LKEKIADFENEKKLDELKQQEDMMANNEAAQKVEQIEFEGEYDIGEFQFNEEGIEL
jgi:hypothetical protein